MTKRMIFSAIPSLQEEDSSNHKLQDKLLYYVCPTGKITDFNYLNFI